MVPMGVRRWFPRLVPILFPKCVTRFGPLVGSPHWVPRWGP